MKPARQVLYRLKTSLLHERLLWTPGIMIISTRQVTTTSLLLVLSLAGFLTVMPVGAQSTCSASQSPAWQICGPIISNNGLNVQPSVIQAADGTLRMAWTARPSNNYDIFYATGAWNGTAWNWNSGAGVAVQTGMNQNPTLVQLQNGTLYIFFSYKSATASHRQLYFIEANGGTWSKYAPLPLASPTSLNDTLPSATVSRDGTLWLVWTRDNSTATGVHVMRQLWYKTLKGTVWSTEQPLTLSSDVNWNFEPSVVAGKDGIVRVAFSRGQNPVFQIYYVTYNGVSWSSPVQLTSQTTTDDDNPSIMQDRNGTFWVFWARNLPAGTSSGYALFDRSSTDNGASWTIETALTGVTCGTVCVDSEYPSAVQASMDKNIWVFYASNPITNFNIYALKTVSPVYPVHDVSISYFSPNVTEIYAGGYHNPYTPSGIPISQSAVVQVLVSLQNSGDFGETVTLRLSATNTTNLTNIGLATQILSIAAGSQSAAYVLFNSTGVRPARYGISGNASIPVETLGNRQDGLLSTPNLIHLLPLGDVDQDGSVTLPDVTVVFYNYGFTCYTPSTCSQRYINAIWGAVSASGIIDISDVSVVAHNYGIYT